MVSIPTIQRWVEPRSSCRAYAHLTDITTSTSFQRISGLLKSTNSASCEPTSTYAESCCADRISRFVHQSAYALSRYWDLKKDSLVTMPMSLAALTPEKNWINQRSSLHKDRVETGSRIALPLELNDCTLSLSWLRAVSPLGLLHTAWEAVVSRLIHWDKQSRSSHQSLACWGLQANGFLSLGTANGWCISLDRLLLQYCMAMAFEFRSWMSVGKTEHSESNNGWSGAALAGPTLTWQTSLLYLHFLLKNLWTVEIIHPTVMLNLLCKPNLTLCSPICLCFIDILRFEKNANESGCTYTHFYVHQFYIY